MSIPANISDWISVPAPFDRNVRGIRAIFSGHNSVVQRRDPGEDYENCVCFTSHTLPLGQVWQITILDTTDEWSLGLRVGVTTTVPDVAPRLLPLHESGPQFWVFRFSIWGNEYVLDTDIPNPNHFYIGQRVDFLLSPDDKCLHIYHNGQHVKRTYSVPKSKTNLWGAIDVRGGSIKVKSELLSDPAVYLLAALKDGYIPHKDDLFLIHGPGGVGKSSLIAMFLGQQRDLNRVSTAVAEESLHICPVRDVSTSMFTDKWELVEIDRQARMVAHTSRHLLTSDGVLKVEADVNETEGDNKEHHDVAAIEPFLTVSLPTSQHPPEGRGTPLPLHSQRKPKSKASKSMWSSFSSIFRKKKEQRELLEATKSPIETEEIPQERILDTLEDDPDNIEGILEKIQEELHKFMHESAELTELFLYYSIRVVDSGGQPQFHEVVSIILPAVSGIVSVFKLSEPLDIHGEVVFYKDGSLANDPYKSYLTNEQVIRHDLLAIQSEASHSGTTEVPSLAFVGAFLDLQQACQGETPDQKDEHLHSMITEILPENMQEFVISNGGSLRQVTFRVNTRTPSEEDYETTGRLKEALMNQSRVKLRNLPLKWCGYEVAMRKLMHQLKRQTLSLQECEFIGHKLGFDLLSLKACLHYLRKFHIISFYDVLPNVVFGSCQVILDKITELVTYSLELKKGSRHAVVGAERKFHQQGIVSRKILESKACSKHYRRKQFTADDLVKVLKSLLIITRVGAGEYLMPCVLEVSDIYPSPPVSKDCVRSSFVLHFSKKSPMLGIYCCIISYLLTEAGWKLLRKDGDPVQVARNSITFEIPKNVSGKLNFLDPLSSYLEVVVELPQIIASKRSETLYSDIRDTFFAAMKRAMQTLKYKVRTPELSFLCPGQSSECSEIPHLARVDESHELSTCSKNPGSVCHPLTPDQKKWLQNNQSRKGKMASNVQIPVASASQSHQESVPKKQGTCAQPISITSPEPTMPELLRLKLPQQVRAKFETFGIILLRDERGNKMAVMRQKFREDPEDITREVLREWLAGKGVEVSWKSLISSLRDCELPFPAKQIELAPE